MLKEVVCRSLIHYEKAKDSKTHIDGIYSYH